MSLFFRKDRRRSGEPRSSQFCLSTFHYAGREQTALLTDLSRHGAGFRSINGTADIELAPDTPLSFEVKTPYGYTSIDGTVKWVIHKEIGLLWGVAVAGAERDEADPARCMMESTL